MPKPAHTRVTFEGVIGTAVAPLEHWSFGINFPADAIPTNGAQVVDDALAAEIKDHYVTLIKPRMTTDTVLTQVTVARLDALGHYELRPDGSYVKGEWNGSEAGPVAAVGLPLQTALCVSLVTGRAGPTGKGRFFLPFPGKPIAATDKRLSVVHTQEMADVSGYLLAALANTMTFPPQVVSSKGYMTEVTSVRVGRVPDTMRSRREDLPEGYVTAPLV